jgi:hypothetical protein
MNPNLKTVNKVGSFLRWLPLTGSVSIMMTISLVAAASFSQLKIANFWQEHTHEVLAAAQMFLSDLFCIQGNARDYVFTGEPAALKSFQERGSRWTAGPECSREDPLRSDPDGHSNAQPERSRCGAPHPGMLGENCPSIFP